jgi:predicted Zn finger-like uncharacterized protein
MIVVCSGCSAKFRVADEKLGPRGAKLRCSKCGMVFSVRCPVEVPEPVAPAEPARVADPFAEPLRRPAPPPLPRPATLDARAAFEVDLEPHLGAPPLAPSDPFAPPAAPPLDADPFASSSPVEPGTPPGEPFAAPAGSPFPLPPGLDEVDPFGAAGPANPDAVDHPGELAGAPHDFGRGGLAGTLSLEELTTPPGRRMSPAQAKAPPPGAAEDPFGASAPLGPGLSELDDGVLATASAASTPAPRPATEPGPPLQIDPFAAAAVASDSLAVGEPERAAPAQAPPGPAPERPVTVRPFRIRDFLVSALALAALLVLALVILVVWRGGLAPADAFRPSAVLAVLAHRPPAGALVATGVSSGLYERARGAPLLFVRGTVTSTSAQPLEGVRVVVEVVRGDAVLARGEVPAGTVPGPEALHGVADAAGLSKVLAEAAPGGARLAPGGSAPFLVAFLEDPAGLAGASLRVRAVVGWE